jgi:hypothetical protein
MLIFGHNQAKSRRQERIEHDGRRIWAVRVLEDISQHKKPLPRRSRQGLSRK